MLALPSKVIVSEVQENTSLDDGSDQLDGMLQMFSGHESIDPFDDVE